VEGGSEDTVLVPASELAGVRVRVELKGFDPTAVAFRDGFLLRGDPNLGYIRHRGLYYSVAGALLVICL
jgi:hypothetical protein